MPEAPSLTTFVVSEQLPWLEPSAVPGEARPYDDAIVYEAGFARPCSLRKISPLGAIVGGELESACEARVTVELPTGQRPAGTIAWIKSGEVGICFRERVNVLALITRKLVSQPVERRAMPRIELRCPAWIRHNDEFAAATVRNMSARGVQLEGEVLPPPGSEIALFVEGLNVPSGKIVWTQGKLAGVQLHHDLGWATIIPWIRAVMSKDAD